jgi:crotonobetainyl-CoA:carnitine CoA-transferase CaiB-like acyl-CoA transferase
VVPYQTFPTQDGNLILAVGNDGQFQRFCEAAGIAGTGSDPRFASNALRIANRDACIAAIAPAMKRKTTAEWMAVLEPLGVPCGPIDRLDAVFANPQIKHRGMQVDVPLTGTVPLVANPIKYSRTPLDYQVPPPLLGEHTEEVLRGLLGKSDAEIAALRSAGVI